MKLSTWFSKNEVRTEAPAVAPIPSPTPAVWLPQNWLTTGCAKVVPGFRLHSRDKEGAVGLTLRNARALVLCPWTIPGLSFVNAGMQLVSSIPNSLFSIPKAIGESLLMRSREWQRWNDDERARVLAQAKTWTWLLLSCIGCIVATPGLAKTIPLVGMAAAWFGRPYFDVVRWYHSLPQLAQAEMASEEVIVDAEVVEPTPMPELSQDLLAQVKVQTEERAHVAL